MKRATTSLWFMVALAATATLFAAAEERVLKVGMIASLEGALAPYGRGRVITGNWMLEEENSRPDGCIRRHGIRMELHTRDVRTRQDLVHEATRELIHDVGVSYLMGGEGVLGVESAAVAGERGVPVCVPMDGNDGSFVNTATGQRRHENVVGTMTPASRYFSGFYRMAARSGARRLAIIEANAPPTLVQMGSGSVHEATDAGLEVVFLDRVTFANGLAPTREEAVAAVERFHKQLVAARPDVVAVASNFACDAFLRLTRLSGWRPKGAVLFECLHQLHTLTDPTMVDELRGVFVPAQWHHDLMGRQYSDEPDRTFASLFPYTPGSGATAHTSAAQMYATVRGLFAAADPPVAWHSLVAPDMSCFYALFAAACKTNSTDPAQLLLGTHTTVLPTFAGHLAFSRMGLNPIREIVTMQLKWDLDPAAPGELGVMADTAYVPFWGLPSFAQLSEEVAYMSRRFEVGQLVVYAAEVVALLVVGGLMLHYSRAKVIRAMAVPLSMAHLLGLLVILQALFLFGYTNTLAACQARWIVLTLGVTLSTTPISLKLYRVVSIFERRLLHEPIISNRHLAIILTAVCSATTLLIALLTCFDGQTTTVRYTPNPRDRSTWYYECSYTSAATETVVGIVCLTQIGLAFLLAVRARNVDPTFSAAFGTIVAVYTDIILAVLFAVVPDRLVSDHASTAGLRMGLILALPVANVLTIYVHPLYCAWKDIVPAIFRSADAYNPTVIEVNTASQPRQPQPSPPQPSPQHRFSGVSDGVEPVSTRRSGDAAPVYGQAPAAPPSGRYPPFTNGWVK